MQYCLFFLVLLHMHFVISMEVDTNRIIGKQDTVIALPFKRNVSDGGNGNHNTPLVCSSLEDVKNLLHSRPDIVENMHSLDFIKEHVDFLPNVFSEKFFQDHSVEPGVKDNVHRKLLGSIDRLKSKNIDEYYKHIMLILNSFNIVTTIMNEEKDMLSTRKKNILSENVADPVKPLTTLEGLLTEELAQDNNELAKDNNTKAFFAKIYKIALVSLTVVSVLAPLLQAFVGNGSAGNHIPTNCSST